VPKRQQVKLTAVPIRLSDQQLELLDRLVSAAILGTSRPEVLKHLFIREVERLFPDEVRGSRRDS
jgi:hypothetical protein